MSSTVSDSDIAKHGEDVDLQDTWRNWWRRSPPYGLSMVFHMILLLALALFTLGVQEEDEPVFLIASVEENSADELLEADLHMDQLLDVQVDMQPTETDFTDLSEADVQIEIPELTEIGSEITMEELIVEDAAPLAILDAALLDTLITGDLAADVSGSGLLGKEVGAMLRGRNPASRRQRALAGGGSRQSEAAVDAALQWFARHQFPDGQLEF